MLNKAPSLLKVGFDLIPLGNNAPMVDLGHGWTWARPIGFFSFAHRLRCACLVFVGKADAVVWPEDDPGRKIRRVCNEHD